MRLRTHISTLAATVALLLAGTAYLPTSSAAEAERPVSFSGGCDTTQTSGSLSASKIGDYNRLLIASSERLRATVTPAWHGRCAMRVEVHDGDFDANNTDRAEVAGDRLLWSNGQEVWYSISFMLAPKYPLPSTGQWMVVDQFFAQNLQQQVSGGAPPLAFEITPTKELRVFVRGGAKAVSTDRAPRESSYLLSSASPGVWHEVLLHVRWSTEANGLVEAWQRKGDGSFSEKPQVYATGPNVLTVAGHVLPVYVETGIYRSRSTPDQVVYYGGVWGRPARSEAEAFFPPVQSSTETTTTTTASTSPPLPNEAQAPTTPSETSGAPTPPAESSSSGLASPPAGETGKATGGSVETVPAAESVSPVFSEAGGAPAGESSQTAESTGTPSGGAGQSQPIASEPLSEPLQAPLPQPTGSVAVGSSGPGTGSLSGSTPPKRESARGEEHETNVILLAAPLPSVATENSAMARAVKRSASAARDRDAVGRLLCGATLASVTMAFRPGRYDGSLRLEEGERSAIASGTLTVSATGRSRLALHVLVGGCGILRDAQRHKATLHLTSSLAFTSPTGASTTRSAHFAVQL